MSFWGSLLYWGILAAIPFGIVLLYFLKLRRQPVEVSSTLLWQRAMEDLQVNSLWQRLRKNLLLFLQLLVSLLVIAALLPWGDFLDFLGLGWRSKEALPERIVLMIDRSASMSATDVGPSRLENAKRLASDVVERMTSKNAAMIISFADEPKVVQGFTSDRGLLRRRLSEIQPSQGTSQLEDALQAATGLATSLTVANVDGQEEMTSDSPAILYLFSDGGVERVPDIHLGSLQPQYVPVGNTSQAANVGIVNFTADEKSEPVGEYQAFARLQNSGGEAITGDLVLTIDGQERDRAEVTVPAEDGMSLQFDLGQLFSGDNRTDVLRLEFLHQDALQQDNSAVTILNAPRLGRVLLVTPGNDPLLLAMQTDTLRRRFKVDVEPPAILNDETHQEIAAAGAYDLIIYDRCAPSEMPAANTVFFGAAPDSEGWSMGEPRFPTLVIDTNQSHPITQLIDMRAVIVVEARAIDGPGGTEELVEADHGAIMAIAPRGGYEDVMVGFALYDTDESGLTLPNTDWQKNLSFPIFVQNLLEYLAGSKSTAQSPNVRPGEQVIIRPFFPVDELRVTGPSGTEFTILRDRRDSLIFYDTDEAGVYEVREGSNEEVTQRFTVNLFDARESNLQVRDEMTIGYDEVKAVSGWQSASPQFWRWLLLGGLVFLIVEWYVYSRRAYL